jgi:F subunit of K+-transporting ATPase
MCDHRVVRRAHRVRVRVRQALSEVYMNIEYLLVGFVAVLVMTYLAVALLRPDKF